MAEQRHCLAALRAEARPWVSLDCQMHIAQAMDEYFEGRFTDKPSRAMILSILSALVAEEIAKEPDRSKWDGAITAVSKIIRRCLDGRDHNEMLEVRP